MDGGAVTVFVQQRGKLLNLLRRQLGPQLKNEMVLTSKAQASECVGQVRVKAAYCGHIVLQQLCSRGAELSFTCCLRLRGHGRRTRRGVLLCLYGTLERTERRLQA